MVCHFLLLFPPGKAMPRVPAGPARSPQSPAYAAPASTHLPESITILADSVKTRIHKHSRNPSSSLAVTALGPAPR